MAGSVVVRKELRRYPEVLRGWQLFCPYLYHHDVSPAAPVESVRSHPHAYR